MLPFFFNPKRGKNTLPGLDHGSEGSSQKKGLACWGITTFASSLCGTRLIEDRYISLLGDVLAACPQL